MALPSNEANDLIFRCFTQDNMGNVALRIVIAGLSVDIGSVLASGVANRPLVLDGSKAIAQVTPCADGVHTPVTSITTSKGIITAIS